MAVGVGAVCVETEKKSVLLGTVRSFCSYLFFTALDNFFWREKWGVIYPGLSVPVLRVDISLPPCGAHLDVLS